VSSHAHNSVIFLFGNGSRFKIQIKITAAAYFDHKQHSDTTYPLTTCKTLILRLVFIGNLLIVIPVFVQQETRWLWFQAWFSGDAWIVILVLFWQETRWLRFQVWFSGDVWIVILVLFWQETCWLWYQRLRSGDALILTAISETNFRWRVDCDSSWFNTGDAFIAIPEVISRWRVDCDSSWFNTGDTFIVIPEVISRWHVHCDSSCRWTVIQRQRVGGAARTTTKQE
jgi:hypothetical protein